MDRPFDHMRYYSTHVIPYCLELKMKIKCHFRVISLFLLLSFNAQAEELADKIHQGHLLAKSLCSDCHYVSRDQKNGPILWPRAPRFSAVADTQKLSGAQLKEFLSSPHTSKYTKRKMPSLPLSEEYIDQLVAYIQSLRKK